MCVMGSSHAWLRYYMALLLNVLVIRFTTHHQLHVWHYSFGSLQCHHVWRYSFNSLQYHSFGSSQQYHSFGSLQYRHVWRHSFVWRYSFDSL
jgi:hypothetical protein